MHYHFQESRRELDGDRYITLEFADLKSLVEGLGSGSSCTRLIFAHEVDHVVAVKHGGKTVMENLALACLACNRYKVQRIGSQLA